MALFLMGSRIISCTRRHSTDMLEVPVDSAFSYCKPDVVSMIMMAMLGTKHC